MGENLSKEDIFLMMKSYENNVKYNTQLYDRQEILVKEQIKVIENLKDITIEQQKVNTQLGTLINSLAEHNMFCNTVATDINKSLTNVGGSVDKANKHITDYHISNVQEHGGLRHNLIGISGGLIAVIIALIVALEKIWSKSDIIEAVAKHLGL